MPDAVKNKFSDDEWFLIASVPSMVGAAMAGAGKSGIIGTTKEAMASMKTIVAGSSDYPDNNVIAAILEKAGASQMQRKRWVPTGRKLLNNLSNKT